MTLQRYTPFDLLLCLLSEIHLKSNSIEVVYSIVGFQIYSKIMHFSVHRFAPIHVHHWAVGYPPPKTSPLRGDLMWRHRHTQKNSIFSHILNMLNILITWNLNFNIISPRKLTHTDKNPNKLKNAHFSPHLCPKLIFNITYLKKTKIKALSLTNTPLLHPDHLGVAHSQIWG